MCVELCSYGILYPGKLSILVEKVFESIFLAQNEDLHMELVSAM